MRYIYIIQLKMNSNGVQHDIYMNMGAYTSFSTCKNDVQELCQKKVKELNEKLWNDSEITSVNAKMDLNSQFEWTKNGEYSRREQEEMMFSMCIESYAEVKMTLYQKRKDKYEKTEYYVKINRHRLK